MLIADILKLKQILIDRSQEIDKYRQLSQNLQLELSKLKSVPVED